MTDPYKVLAEYYDCLHPDHARARTGDWLDSVLRPLGVSSVLDCTCGTGLQAIALAEHGYAVTGSDISRPMLRKAREKARAAGLAIRWTRADVRRLAASIADQFDAVITCGNSLLHLTTREDLRLAMASIHAATHPGGVSLIALSDSEESLFGPHPFMSGRIRLPGGGNLSLYTTTEGKGELTLLNVFIARDTPDGPEVKHTKMSLRIPGRDEVVRMLSDAGFAEVKDLSQRGSIILLSRRL